MIYTLTLNPALDYLVTLPQLLPGSTNRTTFEEVQWGGKGINVSRLLKNLKIESVAMGFLAGFTGQALKQGLQSQGLNTNFIEVEGGLTRINIKVKALEETEINGSGPSISTQSIEALMEKMDLIGDGDLLVMAGNVPASIDDDIYGRIMECLKNRSILCAVDTSGQALAKALPYRPFVIKPNLKELNALCGSEAKTDLEIVAQAKNLQAQGAQNVMVSMAGQGALFLSSDGQVWKATVPDGEVQNSAGAGDSMIAGFLAGHLWGCPLEQTFRLAAAAGTATAFSTTLATLTEITALVERTVVSLWP
ncbi:MAG: 1-phosphofructokinase [Deltaproteobacteria bacterium]|nr:1-phosphofructokinase [Deltaproteobacteria bacterium]